MQMSTHPLAGLSIDPGRPLEAPLEPVSAQSGQPGIDIRPWVSEAEELEARARDTFPLPSMKDREFYYGDNHLAYWQSGYCDYVRASRVCRGHGLTLDADCALYEMGAATCRLSRHFAIQGNFPKHYASDLNKNHVRWSLIHLPKHLRVFQNSALPQLPFADASISLVLAMSVFTHIDDFELGWLQELNRILKPGGLAYLTFQSQRTWTKTPETVLGDYLRLNREFIAEGYNPGIFSEPMPKNRVAFHYTKGPYIYSGVIYHHDSYIRNTWGRFLDILEIIPEGHDWQDVVVARKKLD